MLADYLAGYCAPTLMNLKAGSLFSYPVSTRETADTLLGPLNSELNSRGVFMEALKTGPARTLIYVYRAGLLDTCLKEPKVSSFLRGFGYTPGSVTDYVTLLKMRLAKSGNFPHEIGVYLGYPVDDVAAFIESKGQNYRMAGFWKVYFNEQAAAELFSRLSLCFARCAQLRLEGRSLGEIVH